MVSTDEESGPPGRSLALDADAMMITGCRIRIPYRCIRCPAAVPEDTEPDTYGYVETEPLPVCTLHGCSELEAGLVVHWLAALNDADNGFSGYRDNATTDSGTHIGEHFGRERGTVHSRADVAVEASSRIGSTSNLLDRIYDIRFPDPSEEGVQDALRPDRTKLRAEVLLECARSSGTHRRPPSSIGRSSSPTVPIC